MCLEKLLRIVTPVNEGEEGFNSWSEQSLFLDLLAEQRTGQSIILYSSSFNHGSLLLHSILVPINDLDAVKPDDMMHWDDLGESWSCGLVYGGGQPPHLEYSRPLSGIRPGAYEGGQKLVFGRSFEGRTEDKHYYEIAQFLTHAHNLHWTPERMPGVVLTGREMWKMSSSGPRKPGAPDMKLQLALPLTERL